MSQRVETPDDLAALIESRQFFSGALISPRMVLASGVSMSVQASAFHYCIPREDSGPWTHYEIGYPSEEIPDIAGYAEDLDDPTNTVYCYVPAELVMKIINDNGGITEWHLNLVPIPTL